jgi:hypothetical protein
LEDIKYAYACVPIAKIWGIKNKIEAANNIFQIHNSIKLRIVVFPLIFIPDVIYIPLYHLRKNKQKIDANRAESKKNFEYLIYI